MVHYKLAMFILTGSQVITDNAEIAESSSFLMRCPNIGKTAITTILWVLRQGSNGMVLCVRAKSAENCANQADQYNGRVTKDYSGGIEVAAYSIRVSGAWLNESGEYYCSDGLDSYDRYRGVRIVGKY